MIEIPEMERPGEPVLELDALASAERVKQLHDKLKLVIEGAPDDFVWSITMPRGGRSETTTASTPLRQLRLLSMPAYVDNDGRGMGEAFVGINFLPDRDLDDPYAIMTTEDKYSANPFGDVITYSGAIVRRANRIDTAFVSPEAACTRRGNFTFGPARREEKQNAAQANKPFKPATDFAISRVEEFLDGTLYAHNGEMKLPANLDDMAQLPIPELLAPSQVEEGVS